MSLRHPDLDALSREIADLVSRGVSADEPSIARAAVEEARDLLPSAEERPAPTPPRQAQVELHSEIPDGHPDKSAIETAVAGAFAGVQGRWRVFILVQEKSSWWGLRVEGRSISWTGTLDGPEEQSADFLAGRVREAVQLGLMQSALGRARGRVTET